MDAGRDGRVTAAEMSAARPPQPGDKTSAEKIAAIDADRDGVLTAAEHAAGSITLFRTMDGDGDRKLTRAEIEAGHRERLRSD